MLLLIGCLMAVTGQICIGCTISLLSCLMKSWFVWLLRLNLYCILSMLTISVLFFCLICRLSSKGTLRNMLITKFILVAGYGVVVFYHMKFKVLLWNNMEEALYIKRSTWLLNFLVWLISEFWWYKSFK